MPTPTLREDAAIHEAAHTVACLVFNIPCQGAWISEDGRNGQTKFEEFKPEGKSFERIESYGVMFLSGMLANARDPESLNYRALARSVADDVASVERLLEAAVTSAGNYDALYDKWCGIAGQFIENNWSAIERVSAVLLENGEISATEALAAYSQE